MSWRHATLIALSLVLAIVVVAAMVLSSDGPVQLGPYPTGDGDRVEVTP